MEHPCSIHLASNPCNRSLVAGAAMESGTARSLRALRQRSTPPVTVEAPHPKKTTETEIKELRERAWALGYVLQDVQQWDKMVANAIGLRLSRRHGEDIYQCGAIKLFGIPQRAVTHWAPPPTTINGSELLWSFDSAFEVSNAFAPMLKNSRYVTAGATRALQTPSEPVFRLVATMMGGVEMRHVTHPDGDWWSCNFQYILMDDMGEMHPPKDANRREIALPATEVTELRQIVLTDVRAMGEAGLPLSEGWWRQLGREEDALKAQALVANVQQQTLLGLRRRANFFEVEEVLEQRRGCVRVRWRGYHPSWEAWRISGNIGDPVETWEPTSQVRRTEAYRAWMERAA